MEPENEEPVGIPCVYLAGKQHVKIDILHYSLQKSTSRLKGPQGSDPSDPVLSEDKARDSSVSAART